MLKYFPINKVSDYNKHTRKSSVSKKYVELYPTDNCIPFRFNDTINGVLYDFIIPYKMLWSKLKTLNEQSIYPIWCNKKEFKKHQYFLIAHEEILKMYKELSEKAKQNEIKQLSLF